MSEGIVAEGLRKRYGRLQALDGLYLRVAPGEILGLIGPNGAGKTTTLRILAGLLAPDEGSVTIDGIDLLAVGPGGPALHRVHAGGLRPLQRLAGLGVP